MTIEEGQGAPLLKEDETSCAELVESPLVNATTTLRKIQVILKTAERCNLACPYCYYFYMGDQSYLSRPRVMKADTLAAVANYLREGAIAFDLKEVQVVFHGGEPLLQKKSAFDEACRVLRETIGTVTKLSFSIQTNGTLIDSEWVSLFEKHFVQVGVSVDGPPEHHDKMRPDHRGRGSHAATERGIRLLQQAALENRLPHPATLTVLSHQIAADKVLDHLLNDLRVRSTGFLLPDRSNDDALQDGETINQYGEALCHIFDVWTADPDAFNVREIQDVVGYFQLHTIKKPATEDAAQRVTDSAGIPENVEIANQIIVIQSDGTVSVDDSLIPALKWRENAPVSNVHDGALSDFLRHPVFGEVWSALVNEPDACRGCRWVNLCRGGALENRYSKVRGFNNPSFYCDALKMLYSRVEQFLVGNGYPQGLIDSKLTKQEATYNDMRVF